MGGRPERAIIDGEAIELLRALGYPFELEVSSDVLRNPDDDRTKSVFDSSIRGQTDRFVLRLRKPAATQ